MRSTILDLKNRHKLYWALQVGGWSGYAVVNWLALLSFDKLTNDRAIGFAILAATGLALTHGFRELARRRAWTDLEIGEALWRVAIAVVAMALVAVAVVTLHRHITGFFDEREFKWAFFVFGVFNAGVIFGLWTIGYFAVHYFDRFRKSEIERLVWEAAVKDFELKTLKSQLNPHFMFNALNGIRSLIQENPERAKAAVTQLSNIFRYSLKIERVETVELGEEVKIVEDYLSLERARFEERLRFRIDVTPEARRAPIPPMMVQTLVENGVKHGISKLPEGGEILVRAEIEGDQLKLLIRNPGALEPNALLESSGHGVSNTKQRLELLYGARGKFSLENGNGFVDARVSIPKGGKPE